MDPEFVEVGAEANKDEASDEQYLDVYLKGQADATQVSNVLEKQMDTINQCLVQKNLEVTP